MITLMIIIGLVVLPAGLAWTVLHREAFCRRAIAIGDPIVYRMSKGSTHPGVRAYDIHACAGGDLYTYIVDKYWTVAEILRDGRIVAVTRTNKHHYLTPGDPNLRKARLTERLLLRDRFPHPVGGGIGSWA